MFLLLINCRFGKLQQRQVVTIGLRNPKLESRMNQFLDDAIHFDRKWFARDCRILCVKFTQIHQDVLDASLLNAVGCGCNKPSGN